MAWTVRETTDFACLARQPICLETCWAVDPPLAQTGLAVDPVVVAAAAGLAEPFAPRVALEMKQDALTMFPGADSSRGVAPPPRPTSGWKQQILVAELQQRHRCFKGHGLGAPSVTELDTRSLHKSTGVVRDLCWWAERV